MDDYIREVASSIYGEKEKEPDIKIEEALHGVLPTREGGRYLYQLKQKGRENQMTDFNDVELEDWEREQFEDYHKKQMKWQHEKMQQHMAERTNQLTQEGFASAAKDLGMTPEELGKLMGEPIASPDEQAYYESHFRDSVKNYWLQRAKMKGGSKPRDSRGRFVSPYQGTNRGRVEEGVREKDPDAVLNELLPDNDPIWGRR